MKENADLNKQDLSSLDWWEKTVKCLVFVVCENKKYLRIVELFPEQTAETNSNRLLAAHLARECSNSWIMEGRGKSQTIEPM